MAYRVQPNGTIECDSADEAINLSRKLALGAPAVASRPSTTAVASAPVPGGSVADLLDGLHPNQKKVLVLVKERGEVSLDEIRAELKLKSDKFALSGVLGGLAKNMKRLRIDPDSVLVRKQVGSGAKAIVSYKPGPALMACKEV